MRILICIKQVPDTTEIRIDPVTNTLIREGVPSVLNPYDGYALEAAARIKDRTPDTHLTVLTMGPPQAEAALRECLSTAADKAYLLTDRAFGGSDTLATSYILASAIRRLEELDGAFDMVFCGKQAIDGDTAQVGPEIAEHLGLPQVTYALKVQEATAGSLQILRETEEGKQLVEIRCPCLVTFTKPAFDLRFPSFRRRAAARSAEIPHLGAADIPDIDLTRSGLKGSPTKVKRTFVPPRKQSGVIIRGETAEKAAEKLAETLSSAHVI